MWIDVQVPAHLRQQVAADFFLPILEGGEIVAEIQTAHDCLYPAATNRQEIFLCRASLRTRRSNSPPFPSLVSDRSVRSLSGGAARLKLSSHFRLRRRAWRSALRPPGIRRRL